MVQKSENTCIVSSGAHQWELSQVMLVEDVNDHCAVEEMLAKKGKTWEQMVYSNPDALHQCVHVKCSLDPSQDVLFSATARKVAEGLLQVAKLGLISDFPGYSLCYKMGVDNDGLPYYRCICGTNSVEGGIHMPIHHTFGSL